MQWNVSSFGLCAHHLKFSHANGMVLQIFVILSVSAMKSMVSLLLSCKSAEVCEMRARCKDLFAILIKPLHMFIQAHQMTDFIPCLAGYQTDLIPFLPGYHSISDLRWMLF